MQTVVSSRFAGPPAIGHGGYVAGLLAAHLDGPVQVTLRRPTPLDVPLDVSVAGDGRVELRQGDELLAEAETAQLDLDVPAPPTLDEARSAEASSPSYYDGRGVHPTCFGCGAAREDGLRVFVGPVEVDGVRQVAGVWRPRAEMVGGDGFVDRAWVLAALDCPGAFAFIAAEVRAGLLGRIVFDQYEEVPGHAEHIVTGWQVGIEGKKLFAGTALFDGSGKLLAAAKATWFPFVPR